MQLASVMAGFSLGEADLLRRAMSKKKRATMRDAANSMNGAQANWLFGRIANGFLTTLTSLLTMALIDHTRLPTQRCFPNGLSKS